MARWTAKCWLGSDSGYQDCEVSANTLPGAKQQLQRIYGADPNKIINLREIRDNSNGVGFGGSTDGYGIWICIIGAFILFAVFTPWFLMGIGGTIGWWFGEKTTGMKAVDYAENNTDTGHGKAAIILALSLLAGGFGFVQGHNLQKDFNSDVNIEEVRTK